MTQLALFAPPLRAPDVWLTGRDAREVSPYTHLIRDSDDPERQDCAASLGGSTPLHKRVTFARLRKRPRVELEAEIRELLKQSGPLTFNAIAVTLWGKTADIVCALWALVEAGEIEHTNAAPIRFRVAECHVGKQRLDLSDPAEPRVSGVSASAQGTDPCLGGPIRER
ncbi:MAG: hypothetical protein AB8I08_09340 [Sandaracinaceae bacterium]